MAARIFMVALAVMSALSSQRARSEEPLRLGRPAWLFTTIGHSEWCPAGNVRVDLRTGRYVLTQAAPRLRCNDAGPDRPTTAGQMSHARLVALRAEFQAAASQGLESAACRDGRRPGTLVVSNGGTPVMVLTGGMATSAAPDDESCWSEAARGLHDMLNNVFAHHNRRPRGASPRR